MRRWGILITVFYAMTVIVILLPAFILLAGDDGILSSAYWDQVERGWGYWLTWIFVAIFVSGQALLLFTSVDTTQKRLKPRSSVALTSAIAGVLLALLTFSAALTILVTVPNNVGSSHFVSWTFGSIAFLWAIWGVIFYRFARGGSAATTRAVSWLLKGSVLELLVVVPCHIIVRRRHDCSAPIATGFGITTGIAIMLLSFGPSILFLYKKRLDSYPSRQADSAVDAGPRIPEQ